MATDKGKSHKGKLPEQAPAKRRLHPLREIVPLETVGKASKQERIKPRSRRLREIVPPGTGVRSRPVRVRFRKR